VLSSRPMIALDEHGIAKLVRAVTVFAACGEDSIEHGIVGEGSQQRKMALAGLMHARENGVHDAKGCVTREAPARDAGSAIHGAATIRRRLERAHAGGSNRYDAATP